MAEKYNPILFIKLYISIEKFTNFMLYVFCSFYSLFLSRLQNVKKFTKTNRK